MTGIAQGDVPVDDLFLNLTRVGPSVRPCVETTIRQLACVPISTVPGVLLGKAKIKG